MKFKLQNRNFSLKVLIPLFLVIFYQKFFLIFLMKLTKITYRNKFNLEKNLTSKM